LWANIRCHSGIFLDGLGKKVTENVRHAGWGVGSDSYSEPPEEETGVLQTPVCRCASLLLIYCQLNQHFFQV
jgi:hypothetical protein